MKSRIFTLLALAATFAAFGAQQASKQYVDTKDGEITTSVNSHINNKSNPHEVTARQVGACTTNDVKNIILVFDGQTYSLENDDGVWMVLRAIVTRLGGSYVEGGVTNVPQQVNNGGN